MGIVNEFLTGTATRYQIETYGKREILDDLEQDMRAGVYIYLHERNTLKLIQDVIPELRAAARIKKFLGFKVGPHDVVIGKDIKIGYKTFTRSFLKSIIILQEGGCRISSMSVSGDVPNELINAVQECISENIRIMENGFKYNEYCVTVDEVREWLKADQTE